MIAQLRTALKPGSLLLSLAHAGDATTTILGATKRQVFEAALRNKTLGPNAPIFVHAYDFALPDGRGACTLGPWLLPSLADRGWMAASAAPSAADLALGVGIVRDMLSQFHHMMEDLEADPANNIVYVRTQGTLAGDARFRADWANELHPTPSGFARVAAEFVDALEDRFPGRAK